MVLNRNRKEKKLLTNTKMIKVSIKYVVNQIQNFLIQPSSVDIIEI